jgi:hypothetical protein
MCHKGLMHKFLCKQAAAAIFVVFVSQYIILAANPVFRHYFAQMEPNGEKSLVTPFVRNPWELRAFPVSMSNLVWRPA